MFIILTNIECIIIEKMLFFPPPSSPSFALSSISRNEGGRASVWIELLSNNGHPKHILSATGSPESRLNYGANVCA